MTVTKPAFDIAGFLLQIIGKGIQAYEEHTGEKFDLSLIKPEDPL
jgi:hypothetical protein